MESGTINPKCPPGFRIRIVNSRKRSEVSNCRSYKENSPLSSLWRYVATSAPHGGFAMIKSNPCSAPSRFDSLDQPAPELMLLEGYKLLPRWIFNLGGSDESWTTERNRSRVCLTAVASISTPQITESASRSTWNFAFVS